MAQVKQKKQPQEPLANKKAREFNFKSNVDRPIGEMTFLQRALLFAEVSMISYLSIEECNIAAGKLGFVDGKFFNSNNAQAYWFQSEHDSVVVCRGTEVSDWNDLKTDANALAAVAETVGKVHRGFKDEVDEIWPYIEKELEANTQPLWFCGHSLGGAMANICAGRCVLSYLRCEPEALYTYGSPRIGCKRYVGHVELKHFRWVNNNDIVTRVPPPWLGYRHNGTEKYLNRDGQLKEVNGWKRTSDRLQGLLGGFLKFRIDPLSDHSVVQYIESIHKLVRNDPQSQQAIAASAAADKVPAESGAVGVAQRAKEVSSEVSAGEPKPIRSKTATKPSKKTEPVGAESKLSESKLSGTKTSESKTSETKTSEMKTSVARKASA